MRLRLACVLVVCGLFAFWSLADDRRGERERERRGERRGERGDGRKKADTKPADAKPADVKADTKKPTFKNDVAPLFKDACASCHSGFKRKARLDVTSYDSLMRFVRAGDPTNSKLHKSLTGKGAKPMPPKNRLSDEQIALVKAWIAAGAKKE